MDLQKVFWCSVDVLVLYVIFHILVSCDCLNVADTGRIVLDCDSGKCVCMCVQIWVSIIFLQKLIILFSKETLNQMWQ